MEVYSLGSETVKWSFLPEIEGAEEASGGRLRSVAVSLVGK